MLSKAFLSEQPSKNLIFSKGFPQLSHKGSESTPRERLVDFGVAAHYSGGLSITDCSSGNRFFQVDGTKTSRAITNPKNLFKTPKLPKTRDTYISKLTESKKSENSFQFWEIIERVDSCNIRANSKQVYPSTLESANEQISLWSQCTSEIGVSLRSFNADLYHAMNTIHSALFSLFDDIHRAYKAAYDEFDAQKNELSGKVKALQREVMVLSKQNTEFFLSNQLSQAKIQKEVDEMFPSLEDEILRLRNCSKNIENKISGDLTDTLHQLYLDMSVNDPVPELSEIDLDSLSSDDLLNDIRQKYKFIISSTVRTVKKSLASNRNCFTVYTQTEEVFISPKDYDDLGKQLEKNLLAYQSALMQLETFREDSNHKANALAKAEQERLQAKNETFQLKRELELQNKEILPLKLEIDRKKQEILALNAQGDEKVEQIVRLESRIEMLLEKVLDLNYELEQLKKSRPPTSKKGKIPETISPDPELKKSSLDEIGKSGLTVRQELEQLYNKGKLSMKSNRRLSYRPSSKKLVEYQHSYKDINETMDIKDGNDFRYLDDSYKNDENLSFKRPSFENLNKISDEVGHQDQEFKETDKNTLREGEESQSKDFNDTNTDRDEVKIYEKSKKTQEKSPGNLKKPKANDLKKTFSSKPKVLPNQFSKKSQFPIQAISKTSIPLNKTVSKSPDNFKIDQSIIDRIDITTITSVPNQPNLYNDSNSTATLKLSIPRYEIDGEALSPQVLPEEHDKNPDSSRNSIKDEDLNIPIDLKSKSLQSASKEKQNRVVIQNINSSALSSISKYEPVSKTIVCMDKECGRDEIFEISIGVQVNTANFHEESSKEYNRTLFLPYNPNNIYGLKGDVYYQKNNFMPQAKIPDLSTSLLFQPVYKYSQ